MIQRVRSADAPVLQIELNEARSALSPFPIGFPPMIVDRDLSVIATSTASAVDVLEMEAEGAWVVVFGVDLAA